MTSAAPAGAPRARLHLTGAGGWGILTCLAITAAAANTGNNLLYMLLAVLAASYAVSAWASRRSLLGLEAEIVAPDEITRGRSAEIVATLATKAARSPGIVLDLEAFDGSGRQVQRSVRALSVVTAASPASLALPMSIDRRGPVRLRLLARSPFPFGIIEGLRGIATAEMLVLPEPDHSWRRSLDHSGVDGEALSRKGEGTEIFNIRNYAWGEDARRMDWKATARLGRPMIREYAQEQQRSVVLVIPMLSAGDEEGGERVIARAAGAAVDLAREGWSLRLLAPGADERGDARHILRALAKLKIGERTAGGDWWRGRVMPGETVLELGPAMGPEGARP